MSKRHLAVAAAVAAVAAGLAACGDDGNSVEGAAEGTVKMWVYPIFDEAGVKQFYEQQAAAFGKKFPDVRVEVSVMPWDRRDEQLAAAIAGNKAPDVVYLIPDQIPRYAAQGALEPLDKVLSDEDRKDYLPTALAAATNDGKVYGAPILMQSMPALCNKKVLDAAGVRSCPTTWSEVKQIAPRVKSAGYFTYGYRAALNASLNLSFYPWLWQAGGEVLGEDGKKAAFNSDEGVEALTFLVDLYRAGHIPPNMLNQNSAEQNEIGQGKVAMVTGIEAQNVAPLWGAKNVVVGEPLRHKKQVAFGTVGSLSMLESSDSKPAAAEWIRWVTRPDVLREFDTKASFFSPRASVAALYADDPMLSKVERSLSMMVPGVVHPKARDLQGILAAQIQAALLGQKSPREALDAAAREAQTLLGR